MHCICEVEGTCGEDPLENLTGTGFLMGKPEPTSNYWGDSRSKRKRERSKNQLREGTEKKSEGGKGSVRILTPRSGTLLFVLFASPDHHPNSCAFASAL
jgi:hypothetical protein